MNTPLPLQRFYYRLRPELPAWMQTAVQWTYDFDCFAKDRIFEVFHPEASHFPPENLSLISRRHCYRIGRDYLPQIKRAWPEKDGVKILEVGSGFGQVAVPLKKLMKESDLYWGLEIQPQAVEWCRENISQEDDRFCFVHQDLKNPYYHEEGALKTTETITPFGGGHFDLILFRSVFTHLLGSEMRHYFQEARRMLAPGGKVLATFFLLNSESQRLIQQGRSFLEFPNTPEPGIHTQSTAVPELLVADEENWVLETANAAGLELADAPIRGWWCGRLQQKAHQDTLIFKAKT